MSIARIFIRTLLTVCGATALNLSFAAPQGELTVNGDFELGDTSSWQSFPTATSTFNVTSDAASGNWAGQVYNDTLASSAVVKQANLGVGFVTPGSTVDISFAAKGTGEVGGVAFAELFSEIAGGGVSHAEILGGAPLALTTSWQTFTFSTTAGNDVSGGITLQFAAVTGGATGSTIDLFIDDVSVTATPNVVALEPYYQDFEGLDQADPSALSNDGWLVFANVFDGTTGGYLYGYGPFPAPNGGPAFSAITNGQGGPAQGAQQLVTYSDYNNGDHANGHTIEANVFQEQVIGSGDAGKTFTLRFDAKLGDLIPNSTALAFIKVLNPADWSLSAYETVDMTTTPATWTTYTLQTTIDASQAGHFLQIGFMNHSTLYTPSGIVYDNIVWNEGPGAPYCFGDPGSGTPCPCNNDNDGSVPQSGCANGVFASGAQMTASGVASVTADTLVFATTGLEPSNSGLYFQADNDLSPGVVWGDGLRCAGGNLKRLGVRFADATGYSDTSGYPQSISAKAGNITPGVTKHYQCWYRNPLNSPCGSDFNTSNGYAITWLP